MTNQTPESVIAEVIEYHADAIGSHYDGCYKHHAPCLAVKLRDMLREPGVPDAPRRAVRELIAEARGFWGSETHEYAECLVSRLADALEAAQGAAPQAESVPTSKYISPHLPSMIRNLWKSDPSENSVRTALKLAGDLIQELIDLRAAPVQPSSTVDEAALIREAKAEVLEEKGYFLKGHAEWTRSNFLPGPHSDACAKYNDEIGDELIEDAAELRARAAEYRKAVGS